MHELGVLMQIVKTVHQVALKNGIDKVKHITVEVGEISGFVPRYMLKMFPIAAEAYPVLKKAKLKICMVAGKGLLIKDIGY